MLSGPRLDRSETGEVSGLTLTGEDKITQYNFLRDVNQARNNKITGKPPASENNQRRSESPERLQDPIGERNKHDHEENSLHDHWGEAEHTHSHQVMSSSLLFSNVEITRVFRSPVRPRRSTRRRTSTATLTPTITIITTSENIQKTINISRSISSLAGRDKILSLWEFVGICIQDFSVQRALKSYECLDACVCCLVLVAAGC